MPEVYVPQKVVRREVRGKPVENETHERPVRQVVKTACLSAYRLRGLAGSLLELP
jgi:hypothetical protein